jgi:hypothetical protein
MFNRSPRCLLAIGLESARHCSNHLMEVANRPDTSAQFNNGNSAGVA